MSPMVTFSFDYTLSSVTRIFLAQYLALLQYNTDKPFRRKHADLSILVGMLGTFVRTSK